MDRIPDSSQNSFKNADEMDCDEDKKLFSEPLLKVKPAAFPIEFQITIRILSKMPMKWIVMFLMKITSDILSNCSYKC